MRKLTVAAIQMSCTWNIEANLVKAEHLVSEAQSKGAQVILVQELLETPYFCQIENPEFFKLATTLENNPGVNHFQAIARKLQIVLPFSFFERKNNAFYNSVALIDATGNILGVYRKTHIPDGPGYEEKYYFNPGDTGFKVWNTRYGKIGVGICWDQWFPEAARAMALMGADVLLYPTAIGSEPLKAGIDSQKHWQITMQGHAAANLMPLVAANRIGREQAENSEITFYGSSFITNHLGEVIAQADRHSETFITAEFDLDEIAAYRHYWGIFRDRRPEHYRVLLTLDGVTGKTI